MNSLINSAHELAARIRRRDLSPVEVVEAFIRRIEVRNPSLNALVYLGFDSARTRAREAERALMAGVEVGPLHGVPSAIKDLFDFKPGWPASLGGIRALKHNVVNSYCAFCERMEARGGAVFLGKTNSSLMGSAAPVTITCLGRHATRSILPRTAAAPRAAARRRWPTACVAPWHSAKPERSERAMAAEHCLLSLSRAPYARGHLDERRLLVALRRLTPTARIAFSSILGAPSPFRHAARPRRARRLLPRHSRVPLELPRGWRRLRCSLPAGRRARSTRRTALHVADKLRLRRVRICDDIL